MVFAPTEVIEIENTLNGTIIPQDDILAIATFARANNIKMHLDGARIWHVAAETGMSLKELCEPFDSVSLCFSKGLGELYPIFIPHFLLLLSLTSIYSDRCAGWFMPRRQQGVYREGPMVPQVIRRGYAPDRYTRWRSGIRCDTQLPASSEGARAHQELEKGLEEVGCAILSRAETSMVSISHPLCPQSDTLHVYPRDMMSRSSMIPPQSVFRSRK